MKAIKYLMSLLIVMSLSGMSLSAAPVDNILSKAVAKFSGSKSVTASFNMTAGREHSSGTITASGNMFKISSPGMSVWFDGKTQWTYSPSMQEVNITAPSLAEVQQVNPFAVISTYKKNYSTRELKSSAAGKTVIELVPRSARANGGISKAVLTLNSSTYMPEKVVITMSSRSVVTINICNVKLGGALGVDQFRPTAGQFRGIEVVDLR